MKLLLILAFSFLVIGCATQGIVDGTVPSSSDTTAAVVPADQQMTRDQYLALATKSTCANTEFASQGKPSKRVGYLKGMALTYGKTVCNPTGDTYKVASQPIGNSNIDAFAVYGLSLPTAENRLNTAFALAIGSAARESSWRWFCGKDAAASNTTSSTAEAGLHQSSYNSRYNRDGETINASRDKLYKYFKADKSRCFAKEYKDIGLTADAANLKNWGTGEGVIFQELSKQCPGFAVEYHLMGMRERVTHYGPLKGQRAELKPACTALFVDLNKAIKANPSLCGKL